MKNKISLLFLCVSLMLFGCDKKINTLDPGELTITFINVGQGDAILLECNGKNMLIDGGSSSTNNVYLKLDEKGIGELEYVVCTHPDEDHIGGLVLALEGRNVKKYYCSSACKSSIAYKEFKKMVESQRKSIVIPKVGETFYLSNARIEVLAVDTYVNDYRPNDSSIVLKVSFGETSFLFMGDAEEYTIDYLLNNNMFLHSNVIKVAHHGAKNSSPKEFIDVVDPEIAVISVGANNKYNHPDEEVTSLLSKKGVETFITSVCGTIELISDGKNIKPNTK